jgi:predicted signal transduction protein with EAL and GGDEF domain
VLVTLGERMRSALRGTDVAARIGGDEFAILLDAMTSPVDASRAALRLIEALNAPFPVAGRTIEVHGSIGVASTEDAATLGQDLLREADTAMYAAKNDGKHRYVVYRSSMQDELFGELRLLAQLRAGIDRGEFRAFYQPIVDLASGEIVGAEALIRWQHPERGLILPGRFLPAAEHAGTIFELDRWMLQQACGEAAGWKNLAGGRPLQMSINVSAESLQRSDIVDAVAWAIDSSQVDPANIVLEITESVLVRDIDDTIHRLEALKGLGVGIAIDDFGTGYSSLDHLRSFPVDVLKIDKAFVDGVARGPEDAGFAKAIIMLADQLHLSTVAEGVETEEQAAILTTLGANRAQGFLYSKGVPAGEMREFLARQRRGQEWRPAAPPVVPELPSITVPA